MTTDSTYGIMGRGRTLTMTRADNALAEADPFFFLDYALFSGAIRNHAARTLNEAFRADPNPVHRRLHTLNLFKEESAAYEDLGSLLDALLQYQSGSIAVPLSRLVSFRPFEVYLSKMFEEQGIRSGDDLYARLNLDGWIPPQWAEWFPSLDLHKALVFACRFFVDDCAKAQSRVAISAYNKIKHGLLVVPSAQVYVGSLPDAPAAMFENLKDRVAEGASPIAMVPIDMSDASIEARCHNIEFTQSDLRLLAGLYVTLRYPDFLKSRGIADAKELFACREFYDVRHLIEEVTNKKQL